MINECSSSDSSISGGFVKFSFRGMPVYDEPSSRQSWIQSSMGLRIDFDKYLSYTKLAAYLACTWPPPSSATKWQIIGYNVRWCILFINGAWGFVTLVFSIYKHNDDILILTQSACFLGCTIDLLIKMIAVRIQMKSLQTRIQEMENFLKIARPHERMVLRRHSARLSMFHAVICILMYLTVSIVTFAPLLLHHQPLPSTAAYPFSVDRGVAKILTFIHQAMVAYQCASGSATTCQVAAMMWFAGARLEILAGETKMILKVRGVSYFVEKHNNRLAYAVDVSKSMRYIAFADYMSGGFSTIMSSLILVGNQPLVHKIQFVPVMVGSAVMLFVSAWPAENLINACYSLGNAVYNISWLDMPLSTKKNVLMIMQRCQRPVLVSVGGLLPTMSLRSYAAFLAAVYSYFSTLRAVTSDGSE